MVGAVYEKCVEVDYRSCSLYGRMLVSHHPGCLVSRLEIEYRSPFQHALDCLADVVGEMQRTRPGEDNVNLHNQVVPIYQLLFTRYHEAR